MQYKNKIKDRKEIYRQKLKQYKQITSECPYEYASVRLLFSICDLCVNILTVLNIYNMFRKREIQPYQLKTEGGFLASSLFIGLIWEAN